VVRLLLCGSSRIARPKTGVSEQCVVGCDVGCRACVVG